MDVDEIAVERACNGDRSITLNRAEAAEAFRRLDRRGLSANQIADVLGTTGRTVQRWRDGDTSPITRPGATMDNTKDKIANALRSEHQPIRKAAARANDALATLDRLLADWDAKALARERIAELEQQLAEAKALLRGGAFASAKPGAGEHAKARAWARENGIDVPSIGRVPGDVLEQWRASAA